MKCSILPPRILRRIAEHGDAQQRTTALNTLAGDSTIRMARATYSLLEVRTHQTDVSAVAPVKQRTIYDARTGSTLPGTVVRAEGARASKDVAVNEAYDGLGVTWDFYSIIYQRNSIDGEGLHLNASVHYRRLYDNAFWDGHQMVFGDGDGRLFNRFTIALDVIGHELTARSLRRRGRPGLYGSAPRAERVRLRRVWFADQAVLAPADRRQSGLADRRWAPGARGQRRGVALDESARHGLRRSVLGKDDRRR
jgi:hypothetical protein